MLATAVSMTMDRLNEKGRQVFLDFPELFLGSHALEREGLRFNLDGTLSKKPHPKSFGHPLTHPEVSTDFSESQLELVTGQFSSPEKAIAQLGEIHQFLFHNIKDELLWPFSAPCQLPSSEEEIPLANYGSSPEAKLKTLYRSGLAHRYGRRMQTLSGVHYNFSFDSSVFDSLKGVFPEEKDLQTKAYLHITRNFLRWAWLPTLLFGATPAFDKSYLPKGHFLLEELDQNTWHQPYATSLRLSEIGYTSPNQAKMAMSYDTLDAFLSDLEKAITTPAARFALIGCYEDGSPKQMNAHELQSEAEHYEALRPKPHLIKGKRPLDALRKGGIAYLEVRCIDLDPFASDAISADQLRFLHMMLLHCLFEESSSIGKEERWTNFVNQNTVALEGRRPGLKLKTSEGDKEMIVLANEHLDQMAEIARKLDLASGGTGYSKTLENQRMKIADFKLLPSDILARNFSKKGFVDYGLELANNWKHHHLNLPYSKDLENRYKVAAKRSISEVP